MVSQNHVTRHIKKISLLEEEDTYEKRYCQSKIHTKRSTKQATIGHFAKIRQ